MQLPLKLSLFFLASHLHVDSGLHRLIGVFGYLSSLGTSEPAQNYCPAIFLKVSSRCLKMSSLIYSDRDSRAQRLIRRVDSGARQTRV